jgi:hypothetical protein
VTGKFVSCGARSCLLRSSRFPTVERLTETMPRSARRYDLYLPLADNNGRPFPDEKFKELQGGLLARFGGLTTQQRQFPLQGIWQGATRLYLDLVVIMTVLDFRRAGSARFIAQLKQDLLAEFEQEAILITEQSLRVH